jgi:hypothetical protein
MSNKKNIIAAVIIKTIMKINFLFMTRFFLFQKIGAVAIGHRLWPAFKVGNYALCSS